MKPPPYTMNKGGVFPSQPNPSIILNDSRIKSERHLLVAIKHNKRTNLAEYSINYDTNKSHHNIPLFEALTADQIYNRALDRIKSVGKTIRKDAIRAVEFVISIPPDFNIDYISYFKESTNWLINRYGGIENLICADIHLDESSPHCHILIVPIINGKLNGNKLIGYKHERNKRKLDFYKDIASRYGIHPAIPKLKGKSKESAYNDVINHLTASNDPIIASPLWNTAKDCIRANPEPWLASIGLTPPVSVDRSFVEIMISKGNVTSDDRNNYR